MTRNKLNKLKREIESLRRSSQAAMAYESLAQRLGRRKAKGGKEPMWESVEFAHLPPLSIPHHGSKDIPVGTRHSILDQLEEDVLAWEEKLDGEDEQDVSGESWH